MTANIARNDIVHRRARLHATRRSPSAGRPRGRADPPPILAGAREGRDDVLRAVFTAPNPPIHIGDAQQWGPIVRPALLQDVERAIRERIGPQGADAWRARTPLPGQLRAQCDLRRRADGRRRRVGASIWRRPGPTAQLAASDQAPPSAKPGPRARSMPSELAPTHPATKGHQSGPDQQQRSRFRQYLRIAAADRKMPPPGQPGRSQLPLKSSLKARF